MFKDEKLITIAALILVIILVAGVFWIGDRTEQRAHDLEMKKQEVLSNCIFATHGGGNGN